MTLSYDEAMATLEAMFGSPWNRQTLDPVLRHHKGCMEAAIESVLSHGSGSPESLIHKLQYGDVTKIDILPPEPPMTEEEKQEARELFGLVGVFSVDDEKLQATHGMKQRLKKLDDPNMVPLLLPNLIEILKQLPYVGRVALMLHGVKPSPVRIRLCQELLQSCFAGDDDAAAEDEDDPDNSFVLLSGGRHNLKLNLGRYPILRLLAATAAKLEDAGVYVCEFCIQFMSYQGIRDNNLYKGVRHDLIRLALLAVASVMCGSGKSPPVNVQIFPAAWKVIEDSCSDPELEFDSALLFLSLHWKKTTKVDKYDNSKDLISVLHYPRGEDEFVQNLEMSSNSADQMQKRGFTDLKAKLAESRKKFFSSGLTLDLDKLKNDSPVKVAVGKYRQALSMLGERNDNISIRLMAMLHSNNFSSSSLLGLEDQAGMAHLESLETRLQELLDANNSSCDDFFKVKIQDSNSLDLFLPTIIEAHELKLLSAQLAAFSMHMLQQSFAGVDKELQGQDFAKSFFVAVERSKAAGAVVGFLHKLFQALAQTPLCQVAQHARLAIIIPEIIDNAKHMFTSFEPISMISDRDKCVDSLLFGSLSRYFLLLQRSTGFLRACQVANPSFESNLPFSQLQMPPQKMAVVVAAAAAAPAAAPGKEEAKRDLPEPDIQPVSEKHAPISVQPVEHHEEDDDSALEC